MYKRILLVYAIPPLSPICTHLQLYLGVSHSHIFRRSAVAAGGGTLVASGTILMATPLHPVGHAMALGGVGLLSTEFEAPKKVLESTKKRIGDMRQSFQQRREPGSSSLQSVENAGKEEDLQTT